MNSNINEFSNFIQDYFSSNVCMCVCVCVCGGGGGGCHLAQNNNFYRNTNLCFVELIMIMKSTVFVDNIMNLHHLRLAKYMLDCLKLLRIHQWRHKLKDRDQILWNPSTCVA